MPICTVRLLFHSIIDVQSLKDSYNIKAALKQNMHTHLGACFLQAVFKSLDFAEIIISREISTHIYFD